ncbi:MAG: hypothetical protein KGP14_14580, partial [Betaproteobacteria bacterium]|nr:hypothetical protein [Betaproteobacteria bacterium]
NLTATEKSSCSDPARLVERWNMGVSTPIEIQSKNTTTLTSLLIVALFGIFTQHSRFYTRSVVFQFRNQYRIAKLAIWLCTFSETWAAFFSNYCAGRGQGCSHHAPLHHQCHLYGIRRHAACGCTLVADKYGAEIFAFIT